jgi:hypothetical protein
MMMDDIVYVKKHGTNQSFAAKAGDAILERIGKDMVEISKDEHLNLVAVREGGAAAPVPVAEEAAEPEAEEVEEVEEPEKKGKKKK